MAVVLLVLLLLPEPGILLFSVAVAAVAEQFVAGAGAGVGVAVADLGTLGVIVLEPCCSCWSVGTIVDAGSVWDIASFDP